MMRHRTDLPAVEPQPWAALIPSDSFSARLATYRDVLVWDDDYVSLYKASRKGRPSLPPSLVVSRRGRQHLSGLLGGRQGKASSTLGA